MFPPIFENVSVDANIKTNFGVSPCRIYPFGEAPENVIKPYATWQTINGNPENYINQVPDTDTWTIQIDIFADTSLALLNASQAMRDAIEPHAHITSMGDEGRDQKTKNYRYLMTVDWIYNRELSST